MKKESIDNWLRNEAERLGKERDKIEAKIKKIMKAEDMSSLDKVNQYNIQLKELKASQSKLYEMIGRMDEIEGINDIED
jgi:CRISPR/Cas system-associated protein Csm6